jgi:predicted DNA-binding transcriptional regulator AlpA
MLSFVATPDNPKPTELISSKEVMRRIQRSTIYRWIHRGILPKQAKKEDGTTSALWFADEVDAFIATLRNSPSGSPASPLSLTPDRHTNIRQNAAEIRLTSLSQKLVVKQHKPSPPKKLHALKNASNACFVVGPVLIGAQEAFFDPYSGKIFALIGQLPIFPPSMASRSAQKHWQADEAGGQ